MTHKLIGLALILLIGTPVFAQEPSLLIVETPKTTTTTTVITGQTFIQTYKVKFIDLTKGGEEVVIKEDSLNPGMLGIFEVVDFKIDKSGVEEREDFTVRVWELRYTLRAINPQKGPYQIPPITIRWIHKKIGQNIEDPSIKENTDIKTGEVYINYVTTITQDPRMDIRDQIDFGRFNATSLTLKTISWVLALFALAGGTMFTLRLFKHSRPEQGEEEIYADENIINRELVAPRISRKKARRNLKQTIKKICQPGGLGDLLGTEKELLVALMNFLRAELPQLRDGHTPSDASNYIAKAMKGGTRKKTFLELANIAAYCQNDNDRNMPSAHSVIADKARLLKRLLGRLRPWYVRLLAFAVFENRR